MQAPGRLNFTSDQIEGLLDRIDHECLEKKDYPVLADLIRAIVWMNLSLQEKDLTIRRLRAIFGIKTETAKKLLDLAGGQNDQKLKDPKKDKKDKEKKGKHGHKPASGYTEAKLIEVAHQTLKKADHCPECLKGKLFQLKPGSVIRIKGQPWLQVEIYKPERLRCSLCGKVFTATLPLEGGLGSRADSRAKAIVSLLKYRGGVPYCQKP